MVIRFFSNFGYNTFILISSIQILIQSMQSPEPQNQQVYQDFLAEFSKVKVDVKNKEKSKIQLEKDIAELQQTLLNLNQNEKTTNEVSPDKSVQVEQLKAQIHENNEIISSETSVLHALQQQHQEAIRHIESEKVAVAYQISRPLQHSSEIDELKQQISQFQIIKVDNKNKNLESQRQIEEANAQLLRLTKECDELEKISTAQSATKNDSNPQILELEKSLMEFQKQLAIEDENLIQLQKKSQNQQSSQLQKEKNAEEELKKLQSTNKNLKKDVKSIETRINEEEKENDRLTHKNKDLENQLKILQKQKQKLEQEHKQAQSKIDGLIKADHDHKNEEKHLKKGQKGQKGQKGSKGQKEGRNFRIEISKAEETKANLQKEIERQTKRLSTLVDLKKTYVSKETLNILQKQLQRNQGDHKPHLLADENKKEKLMRDNKILKERIAYLKNAFKQMEEEKRNLLSDTKKKGDALVVQKKDQQKTLTHSTNKLNEYMKEFPNHEKEKEEKKTQEKRLRQERKRELLQKQRQEDRAKKQQENVQKIEKGPREKNMDQTRWQEWNEWYDQGNMPPKENKSIFQNKPFQISCAVVALVLIILLATN